MANYEYTEMLTLFLAGWAKVKGWVIGLGAALLGVLMIVILAFRKGGASATASIEATQTRAVNDALVKQTQIIEKTQALPPGAAAKELADKWSRD